MKACLRGSTLALALLLSGCGGEGDNTAATTANSTAPLTAIPAPNGSDWTETVTVTPEGGHLLGNPNAPVKLVEYGSLTCPTCRAFSQQATEELRDEYVRSGQVSWEFRHLLIHGAPDLALAMLANCQPNSAFFRTIEQIYGQQSEIIGRLDPQEEEQIQALPQGQQLGAVARAMELDSFFAQRGMPGSRFSQCIGDNQTAEKLAEQTNRAIKEEAVPGTPTFYINGKQVEGVASWDGLEPRLREAIG